MTTTIPTAPEVLLSMEGKIIQFLQNNISNPNSLLAKLFESQRTYASEQELRAHIHSAVSQMWNDLDAGLHNLGFPGSQSEYMGSGKNLFQEYIRRFTEGIYTVLEPGFTRDPATGGISLNLEDERVIQTIVAQAGRQYLNTRDGAALSAGQQNTLESMSLNHVKSALSILPAELHAHIAQAGYTSSVKSKYKIYEEGTKMKLAKTGLMTTTILFMTYGLHGLMNTAVTKLAESQPNELENIWSSLLQSSAYSPISWSMAVAAGYGVGRMLIKPTKKIRENMIAASEKNAQVTKLQAIGSAKFASLALLIPASFGVIDAMGIFNREAEGYIVGHVAYQTKAKLSKILDITDPNSPMGKARLQYDANTNTLTKFSNDFVNAEANRPGASGQGPAYKAKEFILKGDAVLTDPILARDPKLQSVVQKASDGLIKINSENHKQYPGLDNKAKRVQGFFENRAKDLISGYTDINTGKEFKGITSFDPMIEMNKHGPLYHFIGQIPGIGSGIYKSHDLALLQGHFTAEAKGFSDAMNKVNTSWGERSQVYQTYIQEVSDIADAKYKSKTSVTIPNSLPVPDLSTLDDALKQKPPKISALWPKASYEKLKEIEGKEGGISSSDLNTLVIFSAIRPFALELSSIALIIVSLFAMLEFYRNPRNKLSGKREDLDRAYNALVSAVQKTFSGETWKAIFPGHSGIDDQIAEYIVREIATDMHPELVDFLPTAKSGTTGAKKNFHAIGTFLKETHQGATRTEKEAYVLNMSKALEKMGMKSSGNVGISASVINRIFQRLVPVEYLKGHTLNTDQLAQITHAMEENISDITAEKESAYAKESGMFQKEFGKRISNLGENIATLESELQPRLNQGIVEGVLQNNIATDIISNIENIRKEYEILLQNEHPTRREIGNIESQVTQMFLTARSFRIQITEEKT